jgi:hypothetical protein
VAWVIGRAIGSSTSAEAIAATVAGALGGFVVIVGAMSLLRVDEFVEVRDMFVGRFRRSAGQRAAEV